MQRLDGIDVFSGRPHGASRAVIWIDDDGESRFWVFDGAARLTSAVSHMIVFVTRDGLTYASCSLFQEPSSGLKYIGIRTLTGNGVINFRGSMAVSGITIASNTAKVRVTLIANKRSSTLDAYLFVPRDG